MIWLAPAALAALLLAGGPILVHLLVRRRAPRVIYPGARFVRAMQAAAIRPRRPSDLRLLLLRTMIVAAAALAVAQPVVITPTRQRAWASRVARAVVVDSSASVDAALARSLADAAGAGAASSQRFTSADVRDALKRAEDWLASETAGIRELVVVSDFQAGALEAADVSGVPEGTGLRFVRAGRPGASATVHADADGWRDGHWTASVALESTRTEVAWTRAGPAREHAVTVLSADADRLAAERALRAATSFGVSEAATDHRVEIAFSGATMRASTPPSASWIAAAAIALANDPLVLAAGAPLAVGERNGVLTAASPLPASSPFAPAIVRAVIVASAPSLVTHEFEPNVIEDATLARWHRDPVARIGAVPPDAGDGRWLWGSALALLLIEEIARRRASTSSTGETHVRAA